MLSFRQPPLVLLLVWGLCLCGVLLAGRGGIILAERWVGSLAAGRETAAGSLTPEELCLRGTPAQMAKACLDALHDGQQSALLRGLLHIGAGVMLFGGGIVLSLRGRRRFKLK